ncbi:iron-containing alcohol dehydrogenase family protein [Candidatus Halobonum tyrrellensis]|uniref:Iron-containing alcohol dehydrogenase n=1 Tax=Candidatus Halobonum tyrrellensis G22 TaxID=1324957 RepID=V4HD82_9EURY|nr:iron-containing alcohol dehydrogenase family protein [Candidatus Halobonum tyrrellensis]ESP88675.1 iron-containing alcohol dehydrogenase [Candidatus Halobonum tyrrellensis G22]
MDPEPFVFEFRTGEVQYGRGRIDGVGDALADLVSDRALVVCGSNTGANRELMDAVEAGLGDRHAGTFDGTTPAKRVETAAAVVERAEETDADAFVPVGGGSSLDVATVASALRADGRSLDDARTEVRETGGLAVPDAGTTPLVPVPTTLAGAEMTVVAGANVEVDGELVSTGVSGAALAPAALVYDPDLYETTPDGVLAGSAMNGFDKAVESLYSRHASVLTDATATRAVRYLRAGLPGMADDAAAMERAVAGVVLAQYGVSRPERSTLSVVHAFGHGLRKAFGVQQGLAHAVVVPHVVRSLVDAGAVRDPLFEAFDADPGDGEAVVAAVEELRDALDLPARLRDLTGASEAKLDAAAAATADDGVLDNGPAGYELRAADARSILDAAW